MGSQLQTKIKLVPNFWGSWYNHKAMNCVKTPTIENNGNYFLTPSFVKDLRIGRAASAVARTCRDDGITSQLFEG